MNKKEPEVNGHANGVNGYTNGHSNGIDGHAEVMTDDAKKQTNGKLANGLTNGDEAAQAKYHASRPEGVDGIQNPPSVDHHTNGD